MGLHTNNKVPEKLIVENEEIITKPAGIANTINRFFTNKIDEIKKTTNENLQKATENLDKWLENKEIPEKFTLKNVTRQQVRDKIHNAKGGNTHGGDFITSRIIKLSSYFIEEAIMTTINKSINEGHYPDIWKNQLT